MNQPKRKATSQSQTKAKPAVKRPVRKVKLKKTPGARPLERESDLIEEEGYTGDRGDARSATSGIP